MGCRYSGWRGGMVALQVWAQGGGVSAHRLLVAEGLQLCRRRKGRAGVTRRPSGGAVGLQ
jgi:hypothetical protein